MFNIATACQSHFEEICTWLEQEELEYQSGFYCKKEELAESLAVGEMFCGVLNGSAIAFATFSIKSSGYVDIMEVHPKHRRRGFGKELALFTISHLFKSGVNSIYVTCAPRSSELFWRSIGFTTHVAYENMHPRLVLRIAP
ncbi:MAG: GNAT family N-acetyltransferase [Methyloversatilis sp.]|nr:GNAT family N-acetyltransferase [Methyloversatilis sp.]